jgi:hypothetical protein
MKLQEIRTRTAYDPNALPTLKAAVRTWLGGMSEDFPLSLTLTLKQTIVEKNDRGTYIRALTRADCERIAKRFTQKLNRQVFGKYAADKCGKSLKYLAVIEGERSNKHLHLHFAIGGLPSRVKFNQFDTLVTNAKLQVEHVDTEHKVDIADSGWIEYITKEVGRKDTDNVLWTLF